jgi:peptidoglycan/xylan/chitin deacetylase (PgdA/CDA1 family)
MSKHRFVFLLFLGATAACIGQLPPAAQTSGPTGVVSPVSAGGRNSGARRSTDVSGMPIPPGEGAVARPTGKPGNLVILPWAGFRAAVTYTFDDANSSQIEHYAELQALGVPMTFYLTTGKSEAANPIWAQAIKDGHELGNHSKTHAQIGRPASIEAATAFIKQTFGVDVWTMASPFGDPSYPPLAGPRFLVNRGVVNGLVGADDNVDPYDLYCYVPPQEARVSAFNIEVDSARRAGKWRIMLIHGFTGGSDGAYLPIKLQDFLASVRYAQSLGDVWIDSMVDVASYWRGQRAVAAAAPKTSGMSTTWTWTLPAHFPPGKYLRVKVTGGTLYQNAKPVDWNEHGYYEISLDAGSLTLSPDVAASAPPPS